MLFFLHLCSLFKSKSWNVFITTAVLTGLICSHVLSNFPDQEFGLQMFPLSLNSTDFLEIHNFEAKFNPSKAEV